MLAQASIQELPRAPRAPSSPRAPRRTVFLAQASIRRVRLGAHGVGRRGGLGIAAGSVATLPMLLATNHSVASRSAIRPPSPPCTRSVFKDIVRRIPG
jgi:hypothetical protein